MCVLEPAIMVPPSSPSPILAFPFFVVVSRSSPPKFPRCASSNRRDHPYNDKQRLSHRARACPPPPRRARRRSPISNLSLNRRGFRDPFCAISYLQLLALSIARPYFRSFSVVRAFFLPSHSPPRFKGRHVFGYNYRHMINRV